MEQAVSERRKASAAAHRSDEDRQAYISTSRRASSVIAKAKAEAWQTTCSSFSPRSNPKSVHSLLRSIAGSPSSSSSSPNFSNCSSRKLASVYTAYLRSHFSVSQAKTLRIRARDYFFELCRASFQEESHSSFCSSFSSTELLAAAPNLFPSTATGPDKVAYLMLKHLSCSGVDFLLHIFNLSWSLHSFPSIWKTSSIISIHRMGKPLDSPASFRPISLTSCVSKLFEHIILSRLLFFWDLIPFSLPPGLSPLMIWYSGLTALFLFAFGKCRSGVLAICFLCGTEATLFFSAGPVCCSFSAEACTILHALCWSRQHQQACHFLSLVHLSDSCFVLAILSAPPFFLLSQTLWQIWQELSSLSSCFHRLQWVP